MCEPSVPSGPIQLNSACASNADSLLPAGVILVYHRFRFGFPRFLPRFHFQSQFLLLSGILFRVEVPAIALVSLDLVIRFDLSTAYT